MEVRGDRFLGISSINLFLIQTLLNPSLIIIKGENVAEKAAKLTVTTVKKALQSVIDPDMNEIKTTLRVLDTRMSEMEKRMDSVKSELRSEIKAVDTKVEQLDKTIGCYAKNDCFGSED